MLCFVFSALVVALDQLFKRYITITMTLYEQKTLIPGLVGITYVQNPNAALSIYIGGRWVLAAIMFVCVIILIAILLRYNEGFWGTLGLAAVLGGAVGNFIDRVFIGEVVDMFEFQFMNFAVFNIADIFITLGGLTFLIFFIVSSIRSSGRKEDGLRSANTGDQDQHDHEMTDIDYLSDYDYDGGDAGDYDYPDSDYPDAGDESGYDDDEIDTAELLRPKPYLRPMAPVDQESIRQTRHALSPFETDTPSDEGGEWSIAAGADKREPEKQFRGLQQPPESTAAYPPAHDQASEASALLEELELLESDLAGAEAYDGDVDDLLREYGFEEDGRGSDDDYYANVDDSTEYDAEYDGGVGKAASGYDGETEDGYSEYNAEYDAEYDEEYDGEAREYAEPDEEYGEEYDEEYHAEADADTDRDD